MQNPIKLQLALDVGSLGKALEMLEQVHPFVDIIELGTLLIVSEGLRAVEKIKQLFPHQSCLADLKIMDGGYDICMAAFKRGRYIVTVLSLADDETIRLALEAALTWDKKIMVDLINEKDLISRGKSLEAMGVSILCVPLPMIGKMTLRISFMILENYERIPIAHLQLLAGLSWTMFRMR